MQDAEIVALLDHADGIVRAVLAAHATGVAAAKHLEDEDAAVSIGLDPTLGYAVIRHLADTTIMLAATVVGLASPDTIDRAGLVAAAVKAAVTAAR